jgi:hypothetical protein
MIRVPTRLLMAPGFLTAAVGMLILTQMTVSSSYVGLVLPAEILLGLGMGTAFMPAMSLATHGVERRDAGVASAMVNTSQQVGGANGTALRNTIAASATTSWVTPHAAEAGKLGKVGFVNQAAVHGYASAIWWAVGALLVAATIAAVLINNSHGDSGPVASGNGQEDGVEDLAVPVIAH